MQGLRLSKSELGLRFTSKAGVLRFLISSCRAYPYFCHEVLWLCGAESKSARLEAKKKSKITPFEGWDSLPEVVRSVKRAILGSLSRVDRKFFEL